MGRVWRKWAALGVGAAVIALPACGDDEDTTTGEAQTEDVEAVSAHWSYSGETGPEHWGSLSPEYAACSQGSEQSPIDLTGGEGSPPPLEIDYAGAPLELTNNGHSVEAKPEADSAITLDGKDYTLDQFHFHAPSEHTIDGEALPLELHFVNLAEDGSAAVLGVLVAEGAENPAWRGVTDALAGTTVEGDTAPVEETDLSALLPGDAAGAERWSYAGSLTTPPCTEGIAWTVFAEPIEMSPDQIAAFTDAYSGNARPVQPLGDRELARGS